MLSLDRCRELLGSDCALSAEELSALRDQLYQLANAAIDAREHSLGDCRQGSDIAPVQDKVIKFQSQN